MAISQTPWQGNYDSLDRRFAEDIVVDAMLADRAADCGRVWLFAAYAVALDLEQAAGERYAQAAAHVQRSLTRNSSRSAP